MLEILPLGGLGEFGMNTMVLRHGRDCIVIDAGMMFPSVEHPGVDAIVPDLSFLDGCGTIHGVVLTHGHEDHIGGIPQLLERHDVPVYGAPHALALALRRLVEFLPRSRDALHELPEDGACLNLGPFAITPIATAHSIPQAKMLAIRTPVGVIVHTGDFKLNPEAPSPGGTEMGRLRKLGDEGVLALLSDSTNAMEPGVTPGEEEVVRGIDELIGAARGRVLVTCFSSNMDRVITVARVAARHGRRLALVGSSLAAQVEVAERLGILHVPPGVRDTVGRVMNRPADQGVLLVAGSQGEPGSALCRIAAGQHPDVALEAGDLLIHSARTIPGNEKHIGRMFDRAVERKVEVVTRREAPVHVSGHPAQEELVRLIECVRPRYLVPVHGEYRQLDAHARIAVDRGMDGSRVKVIRSGDLLAMNAESIEIVDHVEVGSVLLDTQRQVVERGHLRERRRMGFEGIVIPLVTVSAGSGKIVGSRVVVRGFGIGSTEGGIGELEGVLAESLKSVAESGRVDPKSLEDRIRSDMRRYLRRRMGRRPLVVPLIVES